MPVWRNQASEETFLPDLEAWFRQPLGRRILATESGLIREGLQPCAGYSLVELSNCTDFDMPGAARIRRRLRLGSAPQHRLGKALDMICEPGQLPVASESQDAVIAQHVVDFAADPHALLREIERITVAYGKVVIVNFNPVSLLGLRMLAARLGPSPLAQARFLSVRRVCDWLRLLGFEVDQVCYGFHRLPLNRPQWVLERGSLTDSVSRHIPGGGVYMITATKHRIPLTPARLRWRPEPLVGVRPLGVSRQPLTNRYLH